MHGFPVDHPTKDPIGENAVIHVRTKSVQRTIYSRQVPAKGFWR